MNKLMSLIEKYFTPIANWLGNQRHFSAISKGSMGVIGICLIEKYCFIMV